MRRRTRLIVSAVSGVVAVLVALGYGSMVRTEAVREREQALERFGGDLVQVCTAIRDIEPGEVIDEANTTVMDWVAGLAPLDAETDLSAVAGKVATSRIPKRAVLCPLYFEARESAVEVPAGTVAVSIPSDEEHAVGGAVGRGEAVDVYVSRDGVADRLCAATVVDTSSLSSNGAALTWVTLSVRPEHVQELLIAMAQAPLSLVVPGDRGSDVQETARGDAAGAEPSTSRGEH
ncbi:SAF domain-containing protein [Collinsella vaginalis]|uniref:SAF domain-containing protein n=1 Tax=Collinsella vaginalis TaxID=1870987 RepID=UPI000A26D75D|nr:SAF domain-containing protein [Collinsella vaginalis]